MYCLTEQEYKELKRKLPEEWDCEKRAWELALSSLDKLVDVLKKHETNIRKVSPGLFEDLKSAMCGEIDLAKSNLTDVTP